MEIVKINNDGRYIGLITAYGLSAWIKTADVRILGSIKEYVIDLVVTKENNIKEVVYRKDLYGNHCILLNEKGMFNMVDVIETVLLILQSDYDDYNKNRTLDRLLIDKVNNKLLFKKLKKEYEEKQRDEEYNNYKELINNKIFSIKEECNKRNLNFKIIENKMKYKWHQEDTIIIYKILKDYDYVKIIANKSTNINNTIEKLSKSGYIKYIIIDSNYSYDYFDYYNKLCNINFELFKE